MSKSAFQERLVSLINSESMENGSDTPDFILAQYLVGCLENFNAVMALREKWYGRGAEANSPDAPVGSAPPPDESGSISPTLPGS